MKIEICISCIDDGRVPRHQIITWECKGNESRDVRMRKVGNAIAKELKSAYPKNKQPTDAEGK